VVDVITVEDVVVIVGLVVVVAIVVAVVIAAVVVVAVVVEVKVADIVGVVVIVLLFGALPGRLATKTMTSTKAKRTKDPMNNVNAIELRFLGAMFNLLTDSFRAYCYQYDAQKVKKIY